MIEFLNDNAGALTVVFTIVVAIATVVYAYLTWKLVEETIRLREVQTEPKISISLKSREEWLNFINLEIKNIGQGPAHNLTFAIKPKDYIYLKNHKLSDLGVIKNGINYFSPNQSYSTFFANMIDDGQMQSRFEIIVKYKGGSGKEYSEVFHLEFSEFENISQLGKPPIYKISENLEKIQGDLNKLSSGFNKMRVIRYTTDDIKREEKEHLERIKIHQESRPEDEKDSVTDKQL